MSILNLTQHFATADQIDAGIVDLPEHERATLVNLLTFEDISETSADRMVQRADEIVSMARSLGAEGVMIGGAPFFMSVLEDSLNNAGIQAHYAFTQRVSVDKVVDGETVKTSVFKHVGLIPAYSI